MATGPALVGTHERGGGRDSATVGSLFSLAVLKMILNCSHTLTEIWILLCTLLFKKMDNGFKNYCTETRIEAYC